MSTGPTTVPSPVVAPARSRRPAGTRSGLRTAAVAVRALLLSTLVLGAGYTLVLTGIGQLLMPGRADGSLLLRSDGTAAGSTLIGQSFTDAEGDALPQYFQSRPSAAGDGFDATASGGSNQGPEDRDLVASIEERRAEIAEQEGVDPAAVPADALTASGSGLDPQISPAYAALQVDRVARERGLDPQVVRAEVAACTREPLLGVIGEPVVDVAALNLALDEKDGGA
ncbi:potassium-transporting ATPase subunit KdpC [Brachybacterium sp. NBEC-018]|uniref:potassium-transporting ATPase subunit KdpC n=1 Tax=Brachybacterium sp. NBEC-018 TaxID=2996004 RepID=UPI002174E2BF|nr:potassium-transporting ATPase subunit KdpC [Brachybacterium sp. NBEC-018]UVY82693.1 potassium-transporting ATPase subunit KdpC [Brachybacterium sp. NBEC-018]